jgi:sigma-B regulation protein RsbU (phosphoserine phosphatase)
MADSSLELMLSSDPLMPLATHKVTVLLVDDQEIIAKAVENMLSEHDDIDFHYCSDPATAISMAEEVKPTVILQDLVMPEIDGLTLVKYFRANAATASIPLIVLSTKEEATIKAEAFALGANDYMVKLPDPLEVLARIRYHSTGYIRLLERDEAFRRLRDSQKVLQAELSQAAKYVASLLPEPLEGTIATSWQFVPSTQLGGDSFGYHWLDDTHFAIYLLDVCGHGVGAALLSISVQNVLRAQTLPDVDFLDPASVLSALNTAFPMEEQNNMFFTMWYGVYSADTRELRYSSGGHPPAILLGGGQVQQLKTPGLVIGGMPDMEYVTAACKVPDGKNALYVFSDGVYEIDKPEGGMLQLDEYIDLLAAEESNDGDTVKSMLDYARQLNGDGPLEDDFSMVRLEFG